MADNLSSVAFDLPLFKDQYAQELLKTPDADPHILKGQIATRFVDGLLPVLKETLSSGTFDKIQTDRNKLDSITDPVENAIKAKEIYASVTNSLLNYQESLKTPIERFESRIVSGLDNSSFKSLEDLQNVVRGLKPTSLLSSVADKTLGELKSGMTGVKAMASKQLGFSDEVTKNLMKQAQLEAEQTSAIPIPKDYENASLLESVITPRYIAANLVKSTNSVVGMAATAINPPLGLATLIATAGLPSAGQNFTKSFKDIKAAGGTDDEAYEGASKIGLGAGVVEVASEFAGDMLFNIPQLKSVLGGVKSVALQAAIKQSAAKSVARGIGKTALVGAKSTGVEIGEEEINAITGAAITDVVLDTTVARLSQQAKDLREQGFKDQADKMDKNIQVLKDSGGLSKVEYMKIAMDTAKQMSPFALVHMGLKGRAEMKAPKALTTDNADALSDSLKINDLYQSQADEIEKSVGTKAQKNQKLQELHSKATSAVAFNQYFHETNPDAKIDLIAETATKADAIFDPNSTASTAEKEAFKTDFEKVFGAGETGVQNYLMFGDVGKIFGPTTGIPDVKIGEVNAARVPVGNQILKDLADAGIKAKIDAQNQAREDLKTEAKKSIDAFSTDRKNVGFVGAFDALASEFGTRQELLDELLNQTSSLDNVALSELKKQKFSDPNVTSVINEIARERPKIQAEEAKIAKLARLATDPVNFPSSLTDQEKKDIVEIASRPSTNRLSDAVIRYQAMVDIKNNSKIFKSQQTESDRNKLKIDKITESLKNAEKDFDGSRQIIIDGLQSITGGKSFTDLTSAQLSHVQASINYQIKDQQARVNEEVSDKNFLKLLRPIAGTQLATDLKSRFDNVGYKERALIVAEAKLAINEFNDRQAPFVPTRDIQALKGVVEVTQRTPEALMQRVDDVLTGDPSIDTVKKLDEVYTKAETALALNPASEENTKWLTTVREINSKIDGAMAKQLLNKATLSASQSEVTKTHISINRQLVRLENLNSQLPVEDQGALGIDIEAHIDQLQSMLDTLDYGFNEDVQTNSEAFRDILRETEAIRAEYANKASEINKALEANAAKEKPESGTKKRTRKTTTPAAEPTSTAIPTEAKTEATEAEKSKFDSIAPETWAQSEHNQDHIGDLTRVSITVSNGVATAVYTDPNGKTVLISGIDEDNYSAYFPTKAGTYSQKVSSNGKMTKSQIKTMLTESMDALPANAKLTEGTSFSMDGLRIFSGNMSRGWSFSGWGSRISLNDGDASTDFSDMIFDVNDNAGIEKAIKEIEGYFMQMGVDPRSADIQTNKKTVTSTGGTVTITFKAPIIEKSTELTEQEISDLLSGLEEPTSTTPAPVTPESLDTMPSNVSVGLLEGVRNSTDVYATRLSVMLRRMFEHTSAFFDIKNAKALQVFDTPTAMLRNGVNLATQTLESLRQTNASSKIIARAEARLAFAKKRLSDREDIIEIVNSLVTAVNKDNANIRTSIMEIIDGKMIDKLQFTQNLSSDQITSAKTALVEKFLHESQNSNIASTFPVIREFTESYITGIDDQTLKDYRAGLQNYLNANASPKDVDVKKLHSSIRTLIANIEYEQADRKVRQDERDGYVEQVKSDREGVEQIYVKALDTAERLFAKAKKGAWSDTDYANAYSALTTYFASRDALSGSFGMTVENEITSIDMSESILYNIEPEQLGNKNSTLDIIEYPVTNATSSQNTVDFVDEFKKLTKTNKGLEIEDVRLLDKAPKDAPKGARGRVMKANTKNAYVEVFLDRLGSVKDLEEVLRHESFGHKFLPAILGEKLWAEVSAYVKKNGGIGGVSIEELKNRYAKQGVIISDMDAIMEALAFHVQKEKNVTRLSIWRKIYDAVANFYRKVTGKSLNDRQVDSILKSAYNVYKTDAKPAAQLLKEGKVIFDVLEKAGFPSEKVQIETDKTLYAIRNTLYSKIENAFKPLGKFTVGLSDLELFNDLGRFVNSKFPMPNAGEELLTYARTGKSSAIEALIKAKPEFKAAMKTLHEAFQEYHNPDLTEREIRQLQVRGKRLLSRSKASNDTTVIKSVANAFYSAQLTIRQKYANSGLGLSIEHLARLTGAKHFDLVKGVLDTDTNIQEAFNRGASGLMESLTGINKGGEQGVFSPIIEYRKDSNGEWVPYREKLSDRNVMGIFNPYLSLPGDKSVNVNNLEKYLRAQSLVKNAPSEAHVEGSKRVMDEIGAIYDKAGLERPEVQIKALYKDISYMMQRSGKFTDAQVHDMRFRDSVRLGVMQEGVKKTKNSGDVKMGAVDSLIGEISSVTKKMETMHFHKVLTNLIRGFAVSNNIEGQSVIRHLTPEEVGRLTSGKGPMNEQIADFNASSSDQWIYQYMSEGKVYHTLVSDKNVYSSLVAYDERMNPSTFLAANAFTMALQSAAKLKRALIIRWPGFIAKNFTQDTMLALLSGYSNLPQVAEAMKGAFTNNEKYEQMKRQMMMFGAYEVRQDDVSTDLIKQQEGKLRRKINEKASGLGVAKAKSAIDVYMGLLEKTEGVNRVAIVSTHLANNADFIYAKGITAEESRKRYESILAEANFRARDFLNFAQRGSEAWFNRTLQYTPFARVALTGMEKTLRYTQELSSNPELRKKALVRMSAMGMLAIFYAMNNAGDPDYENAEPYEKLNNWILNMGESSIKIPKPFGLPSLVANSIEGMMGWLISQDPKMAKAVGKDLLEGMVPNVIGVRDVAIVIANSFGIKNLKPSMSVTPELISPLIQMAQNQDYFRGGEIASSYINRKHDLNKFDDYNSKTAIYLSKLTGVAANYFDFYSQATFGSETMKVVRAMSESGPTGAFAPMFKRFVTDNVDLRRGAMTQFYQNRDEYVKAASAVKDLRESEEFIKAPSEEKVRLMAQFTKEDPNFFVKAEMYKAQNKWLKAQNKLLSQIKDYDTMPLPEKKKIKDPLVRKVIEFNRQIEALNASR